MHLFRVASGMLSPIPGEQEILRQVRTAYLASRDAGSIGPILDAAFRTAIHAGRRVRHETDLGRVVLSYAELAMQEIDTGAPGARIVVVGTGSLAEEIVRRLAVRGSSGVTVVGRHATRAATLAAMVDGVAAGWNELMNHVCRADAVVACTSAASAFITAPLISARGAAPLTIVDLGEPPNVAPHVGSIPGVRLVSLAHLLPADRGHRSGIDDAERIVVEETERFSHWMARQEFARRAAA